MLGAVILDLVNKQWPSVEPVLLVMRESLFAELLLFKILHVLSTNPIRGVTFQLTLGRFSVPMTICQISAVATLVL